MTALITSIHCKRKKKKRDELEKIGFMHVVTESARRNSQSKISYLELHNHPFLLALNAFSSLLNFCIQVLLQGDYSPF